MLNLTPMGKRGLRAGCRRKLRDGPEGPSYLQARSTGWKPIPRGCYMLSLTSTASMTLVLRSTAITVVRCRMPSRLSAVTGNT